LVRLAFFADGSNNEVNLAILVFNYWALSCAESVFHRVANRCQYDALPRYPTVDLN
jgi:hypothetical protein